ncbi:MAG: hypothetical protein KDA76_20020, partial [Planctomycetaceae bacterium]|nr:hypothetical protein [Planctomycetaceae bacterium]
LDFPEEDVCQIGIGCMVSRVGITPGIRQLMEVARELTPAERLELKKYPAMTWHTLERITDMSNIARQVAWQINERWNGSGYPRGRVGKQIHPLARLAAVSDVFIALTSDRPYRKALSAYGAVMEVVSSAKQGLFEPAAVRALLRTTCLFPIGSYVELTDGSLARVIRN